jgi:Yersinia/Haemophilus virulence surface antigen
MLTRQQLIDRARSPAGFYTVRVTEYAQPPGVGDGICRALAHYWLMLMLRPGVLGVPQGAYGPNQTELLGTLDSRWSNFQRFIYEETQVRPQHAVDGRMQTILADGLSLDYFVVHAWRAESSLQAMLNGPGGVRENIAAPLDRATGFVLSPRFMYDGQLAGHAVSIFLDRNRAFFFEPNVGVFHFAQPGVLCHWLEHEYKDFFAGAYGALSHYRLVRVRPIKARHAA